MTRRILTKKFFDRPTLQVAEELLGKYLVRQSGEIVRGYMITEVEAYDGFDDKASHAAKGLTERTQVMYGEPGVWYVYLVYGMHEMLNIVTREAGYPAAVLIRAVENISGPGKTTKMLGITRDLNKKKACRKSLLWIEDRAVEIARGRILRSPRIGVAYAGEEWAGKKWRFILADADVT